MIRTKIMVLFASWLAVAALVPERSAAQDVWPDCTVVMTDGTRHEHVGVFWKLEGHMLGLRSADRREINLSPYDVAGILDAAGRDITAEVADANPSGTRYAVLGLSNIEPSGIGFAADCGGSLSFTSGFGGFEPAGAYFVGLRRGLSQRFHLRLQYRRQQVRESVPDLDGPVEADTDEFALLAGYRPVHPRRNRNYTYLEAGAVLVSWSRRWDGDAGAPVTGGDPAVGLLLRGGVLLRLGGHVGLDLGALFSLRPSVTVDAEDTGVVIGLNAALALY